MAVSSRPQAPFDGPLPLRFVFPLLFVAVYLSHLTLLRLPYYWDEAGYYIPAAYDFFRTGDVIPFTTLPNSHPPLESLYLSLWWQSAFTPAVTRTAMCCVTAIGLLAVYRLSIVLTRRQRVAAVTTALTAIYPVWFAQSTLAHADMFAAAATLWGLAFAFAKERRNYRYAAVFCFVVAAWCKETSIVTPIALALWEGYRWFRSPAARRPGQPRAALLLLIAPLSLVAWYAYFHHRTGFVFGDPEFVRYNATATLSPLRILLALVHRLLQVFAHMNMFVPVLCALAALLLLPQTEPDGQQRPHLGNADLATLCVLITANILFFSVMGGALLTRYLLPLYPLVLLFCVSTFYRRVRYWWGLVMLSAVAFLIGLFVNPPYKFAPEDNLNYADVIRLHQQAIRQIVLHFPGSTTLTAWPATDELTKPELGYVKKPMPVVPVANFSLPELQKAAQDSRGYSVGFAFSTKYDPPLFSTLGSRNEVLDTRFFDFHRDLPPTAIAHLLDGRIVWREDRQGEWAAVLRFNRPEVASLESFQER